MNIYLERLAITIYIFVIIGLVGLGIIIIKCLQLAENKEFISTVERIKLFNKWEMDKVMYSLVIYGITCLTVTMLMLLLTLIVYLANKKFRKEVNRKIKSYFCCSIRRGEEHPPLMLDEIFPL